MRDLFPLGQAPLPFEDHDEEAPQARRVRAFRSAHPSEERVRTLKGIADIIYGYTDRWRMESEEIEARGTFPYGKSIEVRTMWEKLSDGMNRNGISDHIGWVKTGRPEVSDKKREGWIRVDALIDMFNLVSRIHEIERRNR